MIDKHALAIVSLAGSSLDVLGALYLAYDLLGGEHGPLRAVTRGVTYGTIFGIGYGLGLGPVFGLINGAAHGITLAWEFSRASRHEGQGFWQDAFMSAIRGCGFGIGLAFLFGPVFGTAFGVMSTVGQIVAYRAGVRPTVDYAPGMRPRITLRQFLGAVNRTVGYLAVAYVSAVLAGQRARALPVGLKTGLVIGIVTAVAVTCTPFIEWTADHLPARRMGVVSVTFILVGFSLQSVQYWVELLNVSVQ